jgi:hypothetical protein
MRLKKFKAARINVVIHLGRVRAKKCSHPFLKQSFLLEFAQMRCRLRSIRKSVPLIGDARILASKQHAPIGVLRTLDLSPHFNLHFMDQVLRVPNLILDVPRGAKQRAKLPGPPPDERGLVLSFKLMPAKSRSLQTRHHGGAFGGGIGSQRCLINPNNLQAMGNCHGPCASDAFR